LKRRNWHKYNGFGGVFEVRAATPLGVA
jgi:hypothetical protein